MDKHLISRVARALHEAMRHSPAFAAVGDWDFLGAIRQAEYRAVTHSALVAAGDQQVWVVTDESRHTAEEPFSSVIVVADTREAALAYLAEYYGGADECVWEDHDGTGWWFSTMYGEYPWTMQRQTIERRNGATAKREKAATA